MNTSTPETCWFCGIEFEGWGNNPEPFASHPERCCDDCNTTKVIPARLEAISRRRHPATPKEAS